jgi:phosphomannomutase
MPCWELMPARGLAVTRAAGTGVPVYACVPMEEQTSAFCPLAESTAYNAAAMSDEIQFGTDGWRAVIADGYTFANVRRVTEAIAVAGRELNPPEGVDSNALVVGYDRRFLSREFATTVADVLRTAGYRVILSNQPTPSQTISFTAWKQRLLGGIMVTASHNPAKYNGLKFKAWYGGSGMPEMYQRIAAHLGEKLVREGGSLGEENILDDYLEGVGRHLDLDKIRNARLSILHDPIHGVAAMLPSRLLGLDYIGAARIIHPTAGTLIEQTVVDSIRGDVNPGFGGVNPEPIPENLLAARNVMLSGEYDMAICNDGDADRLGILDERGEFVSPHKIIALLALYLIRVKKQEGEVVKTFSTSRLIEKVATALGVPLHETAIGFKYVADLMLTRKILIGGEESGGIGFGFFLPERDGVLSGLMVAECLAHYGQPLSDIVRGMEEEFGALHYNRRDLQRPMAQSARLIEKIRAGALDSVFGPDLVNREEKDGVKLNFQDGSWLLFRKSGTEPIIRIYCESPYPGRVESMLQKATEQLDAS